MKNSLKMKKSKVSIVIPTYNEKENIEVIMSKINQVFKQNGLDGNIIVSDDNSPDGTGKIADELAKIYPVFVIHRIKNKGYGNSIIDGIKAALNIGSGVVITMDSDLSHNPDVIPEMLKQIYQGSDVIIGSRRIPGGEIVGWNTWRYFCSKGATIFSRLILGLKSKDITSGYRAYRANVFQKIPLQHIKSNGYSFLEEMLYYVEKKGFKIKEVPIIFIDRQYGKSKLSKKEIAKFFMTILRLKYKAL